MSGQADDNLTLKNALTRYFEENGFGPDGGYDASWVTGKFGPVPFAFPNLDARVRAVRFHDLHHIVTGYHTDSAGEGEISAWEIASGCETFWAAWLLNLSGMTMLFLVAPRRIFHAFVRGRHSDNLYRREYDSALLASSVREIRHQLLSDDETTPARIQDRVAFGLWFAVGICTTLAPLGILLAALVAAVGWAW